MSFKNLTAMLQTDEADPEQPAHVSPRRPVVLVIDDDETIRRSLEFILSDRFQLILCDSGQSGLASFNDSVCAVVLDVKMAPNDGFWTCDEIRKIQPDVPVIFFSAYQDVKDPYRIINEHRPFAYISKDSDAKRLIDTLEMATRLYQTSMRSKRLLEKIQRRKSERPPSND